MRAREVSGGGTIGEVAGAVPKLWRDRCQWSDMYCLWRHAARRDAFYWRHGLRAACSSRPTAWEAAGATGDACLVLSEYERRAAAYGPDAHTPDSNAAPTAICSI
jgi:hypothetical protein